MQGVSAVLFLVFPSTRPAGTVFCRLRLVTFTVNSETEGWVPPNNDSCVCGPCGRVNLRQMGKKKWGVCLFVCLDLVLYSRWVCICACWDGLPKTWNQVVFEICKKKNWWICKVWSNLVIKEPRFTRAGEIMAKLSVSDHHENIWFQISSSTSPAVCLFWPCALVLLMLLTVSLIDDCMSVDVT